MQCFYDTTGIIHQTTCVLDTSLPTDPDPDSLLVIDIEPSHTIAPSYPIIVVVPR